MSFWWASQGKNHPIAIEQGSLWTCTWADGSLPTDRALIKKIEPGDVVFHYQGPYLRAVSIAADSFRPYPRPDGYPKGKEIDPDEGWLVTVEPIVRGLEIPRTRLAELLEHGAPGPLDKNGTPQQKYLSRLSVEEGGRLLTEIDIDYAAVPAEVVPSTPAPGDIDRDTDAAARASVRVEQRGLRTFLLRNRSEAECGICGRTLPAAMLVAGHVKPRAQCTNEERWNFGSVAMLVCVLGCDALFEHGYVAVDEAGTIIDGRPSANVALLAAAAHLTGRRCPAFNELRSEAFRTHRDLVRESADNEVVEAARGG